MKGIRQTFPTSECSSFAQENININSVYVVLLLYHNNISKQTYSTNYMYSYFPFLPLLSNLSNQTNQAIPDTAIKYISHSCYFTAAMLLAHSIMVLVPPSPQLVVSCYFTFYYTLHISYTVFLPFHAFQPVFMCLSTCSTISIRLIAVISHISLGSCNNTDIHRQHHRYMIWGNSFFTIVM